MKIKEAKKLIREAVRERLGYLPDVETIPRTKPSPETETPEREKKHSPFTPPQHAPKPAPKGRMEESEETLKGKIASRYEKLQEGNKSSFLQKILLEVSVEQLKTQWVDSGKMKAEDFSEIITAIPKSAYATWMVKQVAEKLIKLEDVYKWNFYFEIFEKYKRLFKSPDINTYRSKKDIQDLMSKAQEISDQQKELEKGEEGKEGGKVDTSNYVSPQGIQELKSVGINFLGVVDSYQVFEVPKTSDSEAAWKVYRKWFGKHKDRAGSQEDADDNMKGVIQICTIAQYRYYKQYLNDGEFYVFINLGDKKAPYQFHYESNQFMDKDDNSVI